MTLTDRSGENKDSSGELRYDQDDHSSADKATKRLLDELMGESKTYEQSPWAGLEKEKLLPELKLIKPGETVKETILVDGVERTYYVHVPKYYGASPVPSAEARNSSAHSGDSQKSYPLVIAFHGYGWNEGQGGTERGGKGFEQVSGFDELADRENFIVVYPDADQNDHYGWNNGQWWFSGLNDVAFVDKILTKLSDDYNVDQSRLYAIGYSQGGSFLHKLLDEMPGKFAAACEVGGWMSGDEEKGARGTPFMAVQAIEDSVAPPLGRLFGLPMKSETYTSEHYREINNISGEPERVIEKVGSEQITITEVSQFPDGRGELATKWLNSEKLHKWYGGKGAENSSINATDETWAFVSRFRK
jgi:polyhydroxybutyrate depolymerase